MRRRVGLSFFFLLCLIVFLALNMPLVQILSRVNLPEKLSISGLNGSILKGSAEQVLLDRIALNNFRYQLDSRCLLSFRVCYQTQFEQGKGELQAGLFDQSLTMINFDMTYSLVNLSAYADKLLVQPTGLLHLTIDSLSVKNQQINQINASALWQSAGVSGELVNLGDYELILSSGNQLYQFQLKDRKALLTVDGKGQIKANGQYSANISIRSAPGLNQSIKSALEFVAKKQGLNQYSIRRTGQLPTQMMSLLSFSDT
ncbi:MAG: type II secretion system protein N [Gammaproteobacteria bacterium]|nr:type II secretion system protein N [Gammaproteobacteria bacterium]